MSRKPCNFYSKPGGCHRGNKCNFLHSKPASPSPSGSNSGPSPRAQASAPPGICNFFWTTGKCKREFDCRFRHVIKSSVDAPNSPQPKGPIGSSALDAVAPFLTEAGLAKVTGTGTDVFFSSPTSPLSPTEAHNNLKRFLYDDFRFRKTFDVYGFLTPISSANSSNSLWTTEDGQLLLSSIATGNGLLRIDDIVRWSQVSTRAGSSSTTLSFQRGFLPLLRFFSSDYVVKSTLSHLVNALYMRIMDNFVHFADVVEQCMQEIMAAGSFKDPSSLAQVQPLGSQVIASLAGIFFECLTRFKNAVAIYPRLEPIVRHLQGWMETWVQGISASPPTFDNPFKNATQAARDHIVTHLKSKIDRLVAIVDREQGKFERSQQKQRSISSFAPFSGSSEGIISALQSSYEGPGDIRPLGRRHDNDFVDIEEIRVAPTHEELISRLPPFLPGNLYDAPHPFPANSMQRLLDIQFRLLREELTAPLRTSVQLVRDDMQSAARVKTRLLELLGKGGGKYRGYADGQEGIMFNVYTDVSFATLTPDRRGLSIGLSFDAPPGRARSSQSRARCAFWEGMSGKRLMQGGLIALVWKSRAGVDVHLGIIASSMRDLTESVKRSSDRVSVRVVFFDPTVEIRILNALKRPETQRGDLKVLVEAPVMFEAIRPFLEALRVEPESIPFGRYMVHQPPDSFNSVKIDPPKYALVPGFSYQLSSLFPPEAGIQDLKMSASDPASIEAARQELRRSRLDPSQADAVVDTLIRELTLIQGPPGTGKSYTGVELIRVLLANKVRPILMIAFTNHALDHMLSSVLDAKITSKVVRLGSRSADERISQYSMETMEMVAGQSRLDRTFGRHHRSLKDVEEEIKKLMNNIVKTSIESEQVANYLQVWYPEHFERIYEPPQWIHIIKATHDNEGAGWQRAGRNGHAKVEDNSMYAYWKTSQDILFLQHQEEAKAAFIQPPLMQQEDVSSRNMFAALNDHNSDISDDNSAQSSDSDSDDDELPEERWQRTSLPEAPTQPVPVPIESPKISLSPKPNSPVPLQISDFENPLGFFDALGYDQIPLIPSSDRPIEYLLSDGDIWDMSQPERIRLDAYWSDQVRTNLNKDQMEDFERLREKHASVLRIYNEGKDEARRQLLQNVDIVGCTTTGAAKLTSLLKGLAPRIMLVEEAGQVLEAHILGSLVPSVEHLILIGDPLQLRPTLNNYSLSMDSRRGSQIYKFDMSLMERLANAGLPMSRIDVQRRMRPAISNLIRNTLYPHLEDHELVKSYPRVRGFGKDLFFLSHSHQENGGGEESASKYNVYEVDMIRDLVLYLLRQGCYSQEGDIVVLCAYLGQLARVRDALSTEVAVVIDDRDQMELADREEEKDDISDSNPAVEHVKVSRRVRLRTVDNFQGEEAKIVILSLVRNSGTDEDFETMGHSPGVRANIGFLKSENRTNVALSRAREGMFILGNAAQLASKSRMWRGVVRELEKQGAVGEAFPVVCQRHPDTVIYVSEPGKLPRLAPDGGCLKSCDFRLKCGHVCPYKCHPDDPNHVAVSCSQPCRRLCPRGHPCNKQCADSCGNCTFLVSEVELPCGHTTAAVPCHLLDNLADVYCDVVINRTLPTCEHTARMKCSADPAQYLCNNPCGGIMVCCGRDCKSRCHQCQDVNPPIADGNGLPQRTPRSKHDEHPCHKPLHCGHPCPKPCSQEHECATICKEACRQECAHAHCNQYCSTPCAPCQEPCIWNCAHHECPVPCGSVCARLPCDKRCEKFLSCGHRCPSVCGEDCSHQVCPHCTTRAVKEQIVDLVLYRTLEDLDPDQATLDELIITLPKCKHTFTVETLDGHCNMNDYYEREGIDGKWLALKSPRNDSEQRKPPVCPTCRTAITAPRYGRVFKRADLDILERNVILRMSQSIHKVQTSIDGLSKVAIREVLDAGAQKITATSASCPLKVKKARAKAQKAVLRERRDMPTPPYVLDPGNARFHGVSPAVCIEWKKAVKGLTQTYGQAYDVAKTRSAHVNAWQAAFSCLYEREMDAAASDPAHAPRRPREHALRMARMRVGQPQPRGDKRFLVEAFWATLTVRFTLIDLAQGWLKSVTNKGTSYALEERKMWGLYGIFLVDTCLQDAKTAFEIAQESESRRQMTTTTLWMMRGDLERFRFNVEMARQLGNIKEDRQELVNSAGEKEQAAVEMITSTETEHLFVLPNDAGSWLETNFSNTAHAIVEEWESIGRSLRMDTYYEALSLDEKMAIIRALNFSHTGHFYNCPNGHTFVIGECGGAMQVAQCPECGERIGGTGHVLAATNTSASDFEELARQQGSQRSPWAWGV